jgi:hypothetical protein
MGGRRIGFFCPRSFVLNSFVNVEALCNTDGHRVTAQVIKVARTLLSARLKAGDARGKWQQGMAVLPFFYFAIGPMEVPLSTE